MLQVYRIVLTGLQTPLTSQMRPLLTEVIQRPGKHDCGQAAEHDRWQHLCKQRALRLVQDVRVTQ